MTGEGLTPFNRETALSFISSQTQEIVSAQVEAADRLIVSQERVASGIDKVGVSVDRVADGLEGLEAAFEWGFSEIVWHLEQERAVLKDILKVLQAPLDTQAKELRQRAEEAYRNGWIDDALEDFLESERKNRYDFTVHHSLGNIYFFHKKVPEKALEFFEKAAKYATPKSPYHASVSLLHIGLVKYLQQDFQGAYEAAKKATELSPNLYEAHYQCAQYGANLGKYDEAIDHLWEAIKGDRNYCLKAESEKDFDVMGEKLRSFFEEKRNQAQNEAKQETDKAQELILYAESYGLTGSDKFVTSRQKHNKAKEFLNRASLFDCWDAIDTAWDVPILTLDALEAYVSNEISRTFERSEGEKHELEKQSRSGRWMPGALLGFLLAGGLVLYTIYEWYEKGEIAGLFDVILCFTFAIIALAFWGGTLGAIGALIVWPIGFLICTPVYKFLIKRVEGRYESRLAELHERLSEIQSKRSELNRKYKQKEKIE